MTPDPVIVPPTIKLIRVSKLHGPEPSIFARLTGANGEVHVLEPRSPLTRLFHIQPTTTRDPSMYFLVYGNFPPGRITSLPFRRRSADPR